jgi:hypothetical protein
VRRKDRMIRQQSEIFTCYEPEPELHHDEQLNDPECSMLNRTPLECIPNGTMTKVLRDLGYDASLKIMNGVQRVEARVARRINITYIM